MQDESSTRATSYDYDANGSQTGITTQVGVNAPSYVKQMWDFEGHLTARGATDVNGNWGNTRNEYSYDANGLRLSQSTVAQSGTVSNKTSYLWNGDRLLEERDKDNVLLARYEHGQELGPLSMLRPATSTIAAQTRYFIGDGQDSTRQLLDESGTVKDSYFYDSFGVDLNGGQQTSTNSFKYTGQQQDESGLYYLRARYYEAGSGRFLSHDPEMGGSDDPISMHRYLYAGADPVNGVDPSGRETMMSVGTSFAVQAIEFAVVGAAYGAGYTVATANINAITSGNVISGAIAGIVTPFQMAYSLVSYDPMENPLGGVKAGTEIIRQMVESTLALVKVLRDPNKTINQKLLAGVLLSGIVYEAARAHGASREALKAGRNQRSIAIFEERLLDDVVESGGRRDSRNKFVLDQFDEARAEKVYDEIRATDDVAIIAEKNNLNFDTVKAIKGHLFYDTHELYKGVGRFDADPFIANAWKRLQEGAPKPEDFDLLAHEAYELRLMREENMSYRDAHAKTEKDGYEWHYPEDEIS